jgi:hypothetical protein
MRWVVLLRRVGNSHLTDARGARRPVTDRENMIYTEVGGLLNRPAQGTRPCGIVVRRSDDTQSHPPASQQLSSIPVDFSAGRPVASRRRLQRSDDGPDALYIVHVSRERAGCIRRTWTVRRADNRGCR